MQLTTQHKLLCLFASGENPFWVRFAKLCGRLPASGVLRLADLEDLGGFGHQTVRNWQQGKGSIRASTVENTMKGLAHKLRQLLATLPNEEQRAEAGDLLHMLERFSDIYREGTLDLYDVAPIFDMSVRSCQELLDKIIYSQRPILPAAWYSGAGDAALGESHFNEFGGLYLMWVQRGPIWLQCPVRVRYLLPVGNAAFIRCKLNFPKIVRSDDESQGRPSKRRTPRSHYWEYDGALSVREHHLYWVFEKRTSERNDYFYMITERAWVPAPGNARLLRGRYMTTGQGRDPAAERSEVPPIAMDYVLMSRLYDGHVDESSKEFREIMWTSAKVLDQPEELEVAQKRWQQYGYAQVGGYFRVRAGTDGNLR